MDLECKIHAFLVEPKPFTELNEDIETWRDIENLYTVAETVVVSDESVGEIIEEQKAQVAPQVCFKFMIGSELQRIHHRLETEHRNKFKQRLISSDRFTERKITELASRFFTMVFPAYDIRNHLLHKDSDKEVPDEDVIPKDSNCFENGILYERLDDGTKRLIRCLDKSINMIDNPTVSIIESKAFKDCYFLQDIKFLNARLVKNKAFQHCTGLVNVEFGDDVVFTDSIAQTFDCPLIIHEKSQIKTIAYQKGYKI